MERATGEKIASLKKADASSVSSREQQEKTAATKSYDAEDDFSDGDSGSDTEAKGGEPTSTDRSSADSKVKTLGDLARIRREKRLAMNRESARVRRKRKKLILETLQQQVDDLTRRNHHFQNANEDLTAQVLMLENELTKARSTISMLSSQTQLTRQSLVNPLSLSSGGFGFASASADPRQSRLQQYLLQNQPEAESAQRHGFTPTAFGGSSDYRALLQRQMLSQATRDSFMMSNLGILPLPNQGLDSVGGSSQNQVCQAGRTFCFPVFTLSCVDKLFKPEWISFSSL